MPVIDRDDPRAERRLFDHLAAGAIEHGPKALRNPADPDAGGAEHQLFAINTYIGPALERAAVVDQRHPRWRQR